MMQASIGHGGENGAYTRQRVSRDAQHLEQQPRLGGHTPYRDDPNYMGTSTFFTPQSHPTPSEKGKDLPLWRRICCQRVTSLVCCRPVSSAHDNEELFYQDKFNDLSWSCSIGTTDDNGVWLNLSDPAGTGMSLMVWLLMGYSVFTMNFLASHGGIPNIFALLYSVLAALALACHGKTSLTDPGAVPASAVPTEQQRKTGEKLSMCSQCQTFKPPQSHHCRICNRCISRMDHHCPWMNNCIGAANMKHFLLFLLYTWTGSVLSLILLGWNYFFCDADDCKFTFVLWQLLGFMTILSAGAFLFTSSMLMNVCYGLMTGIGTIDRLKKKANNTMEESDAEQIPLEDVFGIGPYYTWPFPVDPILKDHDQVMGYSTPQRLLREQINATGMDDSYTDIHSIVSSAFH